MLTSCRNTGHTNGSLETDSICINETTHLFADTAAPACNLRVNLAYATHARRPGEADSLNTYFINVALGEKYDNLPPQEAVAKYARQYASDYRNDLEPTYAEDLKEDDSKGVDAWYSYYRNIESRVQCSSNRLLVYCVKYEEYTGGAHGIYARQYYNIDLHSLSPIRLTDVLIPDCEEELSSLLWQQLAADHQSTRQELEDDMGYGSTGPLVPTENFYLDPLSRQLTFQYNVYEIAPYSTGDTSISLPIEAVEHLLTDYGHTLLDNR